jgi:Cof subfamily protein (haloacid dehalogenase superfamily)
MFAMIKLVALDLDGTIVDENLQISARTLEILTHIREEKQVRVILATGRMFPSTVAFARKVGVTDPVISYQGGMIRDIAEPRENILEYPILFHRPIEMEVSRSIIDFIHAEGVHANLYVNDCLFTTHHNPQSEFYRSISGVTPVEAKNLHDVLTAPPSKMMIIDDRCDEIIATLQNRFPKEVSICKSRETFCEIVHPTVSKWLAISYLMEQWQIQADEVMAIGDHENDIPMIQGAGIGVAMGNAPDHVKAEAHYVTESVNQDGAAKAIEKFVLC